MIRRLQPAGQEGIALAMTLLVMALSSTVLISVIQYTSSSGRDANANHARQVAYGLAEAGINNALSVLNNATNPRTASLLPGATSTYTQGTATYSGVFTAATNEWLVTSVGSAPNPAGGTAIARTLTRRVMVAEAPNGPTYTKWSRIYNDDTATCLTIPSVNIPSPLTTRSPLCLTGSTQLTGSAIQVGGLTTQVPGTDIGVATNSPVQTFVGVGGCKYAGGPVLTPCTESAHVYSINPPTTTLTDGVKPTVDPAYWYANAKPGPTQNCTTGSFPGGFDTNAIYDKSRGQVTLMPTSSYTCEVRDGSGNLVGQLSWDYTNKILSIKGSVFFDGPMTIGDTSWVARYQGRATMYVAGRVTLQGTICAGGTGDCKTNMASWDPTANMLVVVAGDKETEGYDITFGDSDGDRPAAYQGVLYAKNDCLLDVDEASYTQSSGPLICNRLKIDVGPQKPQFYTWPPLGTLLEGQTHGSTPQPGDYTVMPGTQSG